jgi:hypothetical protein
MPRDIWPNLSVNIRRRLRPCIAEPHLCLSHHGAAVIRGLVQHAEIWLGAEFLSILDDALLYEREPSLLAGAGADEVRHALRIWSELRDDVGQAGGCLYWVRDPLRDSSLPAGMSDSVVGRWELLTQSLDSRLAATADASGPMIAASRDTAALAAVLPGAIVLTLRPQHSAGAPQFCRDLEAWGVSCRHVDPDDDLVTLERGLLLCLLVEAGLAGFLWRGLRLAVVHIVAPSPVRAPFGHALAYAGDDADFLLADAPGPPASPWDDATAFWYDLASEDSHGGA